MSRSASCRSTPRRLACNVYSTVPCCILDCPTATLYCHVGRPSHRDRKQGGDPRQLCRECRGGLRGNEGKILGKITRRAVKLALYSIQEIASEYKPLGYCCLCRSNQNTECRFFSTDQRERARRRDQPYGGTVHDRGVGADPPCGMRVHVPRLRGIFSPPKTWRSRRLLCEFSDPVKTTHRSH